jgi:hypothetical protein
MSIRRFRKCEKLHFFVIRILRNERKHEKVNIFQRFFWEFNQIFLENFQNFTKLYNVTNRDRHCLLSIRYIVNILNIELWNQKVAKRHIHRHRHCLLSIRYICKLAWRNS